MDLKKWIFVFTYIAFLGLLFLFPFNDDQILFLPILLLESFNLATVLVVLRFGHFSDRRIQILFCLGIGVIAIGINLFCLDTKRNFYYYYIIGMNSVELIFDGIFLVYFAKKCYHEQNQYQTI